MPPAATTINLTPSRIATALFAVAAALVGVHVILQVLHLGFGRDHVFGLTDLFHLDLERNIPSFFGALLLLLAAAALGLTGIHMRSVRAPLAGRWLGLGAVFILLALDEVIGMHEWWGLQVGASFRLGEWTYVAWPVMAIAALSALYIYYRPWFFAFDSLTRRGVLLAAAIYVGGAVGLELVEAGYWAWIGTETYDAIFAMMTTTEETMEMLGMILFIRVLLDHAARLGVRVRFTATDPAPAVVRSGTAAVAALNEIERPDATGTDA